MVLLQSVRRHFNKSGTEETFCFNSMFNVGQLGTICGRNGHSSEENNLKLFS